MGRNTSRSVPTSPGPRKGLLASGEVILLSERGTPQRLADRVRFFGQVAAGAGPLGEAAVEIFAG